MRRSTVLSTATALLLLANGALGAATISIENGTVHPVSEPSFVGRVVVEDGRIAAVGPAVAVPAGATRIDAFGLHVYPGLFDAVSQLGLVEIGAVSATDDRAELGTYNPHLKAAAAIHPASDLIPVARAAGITHTVVAPRSGRDGVIAGQAALVHLAGWTVEEMAIDDAVAMVVTWPAIVTRRFNRSTFSVDETPFKEAEETAKEERDELLDWLEAARHYRQAVGSGSPRVERNLQLEALAGVLDRGQPILVAAQAKRDIVAAVELAAAEDLDIVIAGGRDAWKVKEMLAEKGVPVVLGFPQSLPREADDPYDRPFRNAAELHGAGVRIAFASGAGGGGGPGGPHASRTVPHQSGFAAAYGLPAEVALRAVTLSPAEIFGVDDRLGSIEAGKIANLIVTDGSPLEIETRVLHLIIDGEIVSTDNRHERLYRQYRSR